MTSFEQDALIFIVRLWREERELEDAEPVWRGVVEHIPSGQRQYVADLATITAFLAQYLDVDPNHSC